MGYLSTPSWARAATRFPVRRLLRAHRRCLAFSFMDSSSQSTDDLRRSLAAEQRVTADRPGDNPEVMEQTIQELHVHRIELEMQNRALREAQSEFEFAMQRYADLYDHLPI